MSDELQTPPPQLNGSLPELPNSYYSEVEVLVSLLQKDEGWDAIVGEISAEDFFDPFHRKLFQAMKHLANGGSKIGLPSVSARLQETGDFPSDLLETRLRDIYDYPMMRDIMGSVKFMRAKSMLRELIGTAETIIHEAYKQDEQTVYEFLGKAEDRVANISEHRGFEIEDVHLQRYVDEIRAQLAYIDEHGKPRRGVLSGFSAIDEITSGFHRSDLIVIAARPGVGKTTLGLNIAEQAVLNNEAPLRVVFFTLEQPGEQLLFKLVASIARIDHKKLRTERLTLEDNDRLTSATGQLLESGDRLLIDQASKLTVSDIRSRTRNIERRIGKADLILVDYLQLMSSDDRSRRTDTRALEVAQITRGLKHIAMDLELPVIVMSQLNRKPTERKNNRPFLADLRDSGAIEQDADMVLLMHRDDMAKGEDNGSGITDLDIAKHRHGPTGRRRLVFDGRYSRFRDFTARDESEHLRNQDDDGSENLDDELL